MWIRLVLAFALVGCSDGASIGLEVHSVEDVSDTPGFVPWSVGARPLAVNLTLLNATESPITVAFEAFVIEPSAGPLLSGHPLTSALAEPCGGTLMPGNQTTCSVAFEVPEGFVAERLAFDFGSLRAIAPLTFRIGEIGRPRAGATAELDLLLAIDNSGSMGEEQASLSAELPRLVRILSSGDIDQDGSTTGPEDFPPFDLRIGVITTDMGVGGFSVPTCARADFGDDGILRTEGRTDITGCMATYPSFLGFDPESGESPDDFARQVACVATVGTGGCGFEQQLEAVLKALSPSEPNASTHVGFRAPTFFRNTSGHGDTNNAGFLRPDSVLAIVLASDEDDCSTIDPALFEPASPFYGDTDLNLRCFAHAAEAVHPLSRFVDGFVQLRRNAHRLVYVPIVGIPIDLEPAPGEPLWEHVVAEDEANRDIRMVERTDPAMPSRLIPSCGLPGRGMAFPPVRIVRVAEELERFGAHTSVGSICRSSFTRAFDLLIREIRDAGRAE